MLSGTEPVLQLTAATNSEKPHVELTALDKPRENLAHAHNRRTTLYQCVRGKEECNQDV